MGTTAEKLQAILNSKAAIKAAIEEKTGENPGNVFANYPDAIRSIPTGSGSGWTGHADIEGLKAIGWDDNDIAYYQKYGVNWNEEDDEYHKVPEDNIALYGILTPDNIQQYKDIIVYLPKIDISGYTQVKFNNLYSLVAVPTLDMSELTNTSQMYTNDYSLVCVPPIYAPKTASLFQLFMNCSSLVWVESIYAPESINIDNTFNNCHSLIGIKNIYMHRKQII